MIRFEIKSNEFSYDLKALALSFFPEKGCEVLQRLAGVRWISAAMCDGWKGADLGRTAWELR